MNRPYYALAALLAVLTGSAMAVAPARCQSTTASAALASRSLCGLTTRDYVVASNLFVHFEAGKDAGPSEANSDLQGSNNNPVPSYQEACGYDPLRDEQYDDSTQLADEQEVWPTDERIDESFADFEGCDQPAEVCQPTQCGGDYSSCPYYGGYRGGYWYGDVVADQYADFDYWSAYADEFAGFDYWSAYANQYTGFDYWSAYADQFDYWTVYSEEFNYWTVYQYADFNYWTAYAPTPADFEIASDFEIVSELGDDWDCGEWREYQQATDELACQQAYGQWLAEQEAREQVAVAEMLDESAFFTDEAWKTQLVEVPHWIEEYVLGVQRSIEEQYAAAELQAAREAGVAIDDSVAQYGPVAPTEAAYDNEYESLYDLDEMLEDEGDEDEMDEEGDDEEVAAEDDEDGDEDNGAVYRALRRMVAQLFESFGDVLAEGEEDSSEWLESAEEAIEELEDVSTQWQLPLETASPPADYTLQTPATQYGLPEEAAESREILQSVAKGLRLAGQALLVAADGLETEAERVLSARGAWPLSR